jgi:hypothetical protein
MGADMLRPVLAVVAGVVVGVVLIWVVENIGLYLFPPPPDIDMTDPDSLRTMMQRAPLGALLSVLVGWTLGAFTASLTAIRVSRLGVPWPGWAAAGILLAMSVVNMVMIPHPFWFVAASLLFMSAAGWGGGRLIVEGPGEAEDGYAWGEPEGEFAEDVEETYEPQYEPSPAQRAREAFDDEQN